MQVVIVIRNNVESDGESSRTVIGVAVDEATAELLVVEDIEEGREHRDEELTRQNYDVFPAEVSGKDVAGRVTPEEARAAGMRRRAADLSYAELLKIVEDVQAFLWMDCLHLWDPEKDINGGDLVQDAGGTLADAGLMPTQQASHGIQKQEGP